jgi:excisionase family DNA binding protein
MEETTPINLNYYSRLRDTRWIPAGPASSGTLRALMSGIGGTWMMPSQTESNDSREPRIGRSVSLDHAAELLGVSRRTIYNRIRENRLRTIRTAGGSQRVLVDSIGELHRRELSKDLSDVESSTAKQEGT